MSGKAKGGSDVTFGDFGIQVRTADRGCPLAHDPTREAWWKVWIRVFPDRPVTKKPAQTGTDWLGQGQPRALGGGGQALAHFELAGVEPELAREAMDRAIQKLPFKARFVIRPGTHGTPEVQV